MEMLVAALTFMIMFVYLMKKICGSFQNQPQTGDAFPVDAAIFAVSESGTAVDVINSVPWEAGADILGECETYAEIVETSGAGLEILFELFVW